MLLPLIFLWLAACHKILASNTAKPWETMYWYSVYKAEVLSGITPRAIGGKCTHNSAHFPAGESAYKAEIEAAGYTAAICTFDEFIKHIGDSRGWAEYKFTADGATIFPDWKKITTKTSTMVAPHPLNGRPLPYRENLQNLLSNHAHEPTMSMAKIMKEVINAMQAARSAFAKISNPSAILTEQFLNELKEARTCASIAQQLRVAEERPHLNERAKAYRIGTPFAATNTDQKVFGPPIEGNTGELLFTYKDEVDTSVMFDPATTSEATEADKNNFLSKLEKFGTDADKEEGDSRDVKKTKNTARNHKAAHVTIKESVDLLDGLITDCTPSTIPKRGLFASTDRYDPKFRRLNQYHSTNLEIGLISADIYALNLRSVAS